MTDGSLGMKGAIAKAKEIVTATSGAIEAGQFVNQANPAIHYRTTGPEIWQDTDGAVDIYVAGVGYRWYFNRCRSLFKKNKILILK